jgi:hypothetical protein
VKLVDQDFLFTTDLSSSMINITLIQIRGMREFSMIGRKRKRESENSQEEE